jgi:hypothetical protein
MACGYLASYLWFAKPRGFKGDFYAAMYDPSWWDGQGIFYGPIFVFERWIVNSFPDVVSVQFFALTYLILIVVCLLIAINTINARGKLLVFCVAIWSLNTFFYYGFSVAANPEILELFFLLFMWWSLANKHFNLAYLVFTCAVLTKLAPAILAPIFLLYFSWSGVALSALAALFLFSVVSIGQKQSLLESLTQTLALNPADPQPTSEQFLGLSSALSRLFGLTTNSNFYAVETVSLVVLLLFYAFAVLALKRLYKLRTNFAHREIVAYTFALFMTLLPLMHLGQAHRHTFIFLAPVFLAMKYLTMQIKDLKERRRWNYTVNIIFLAYTFLPLYGLDIYNFDDLEGVIFFEGFQSTLVMLTEPVWVNVFLFLIVLKFGNKVMSLRVRHANALPLSAKLLRFRTL